MRVMPSGRCCTAGRGALAMRSEGSKYFDDYVFALNWAQTYAKIDRELMMVHVLDARTRR